MFGGFIKICHNNPIFSYNETKITGIQLENFRTSMVIAHDDWSLQLRQSLVCEVEIMSKLKLNI
jgi:hypothetical protein